MDALDGERIVQQYTNWLREEFRTSSYDNGVCEITLPFLNRRGTYLQVFVSKTDSGLMISDYGETIGDLRFSGFDIDTETRRKELDSILRSFSVTLVGRDELQILTSEEKLPDYMNELVQCMLTVDLMIYMAPHTVAQLYAEDTRAARESEKKPLAATRP